MKLSYVALCALTALLMITGAPAEASPIPHGHPHHPRIDRDNNPPGHAGGPGTNWENPPGHAGGPGAGPDRPRDRDNNPPGRAGGPGTNWENPPGRAGGPGASPNRR